jgi:hypothetical protein
MIGRLMKKKPEKDVEGSGHGKIPALSWRN